MAVAVAVAVAVVLAEAQAYASDIVAPDTAAAAVAVVPTDVCTQVVDAVGCETAQIVHDAAKKIECPLLQVDDQAFWRHLIGH